MRRVKVRWHVKLALGRLVEMDDVRSLGKLLGSHREASPSSGRLQGARGGAVPTKARLAAPPESIPDPTRAVEVATPGVASPQKAVGGAERVSRDSWPRGGRRPEGAASPGH